MMVNLNMSFRRWKPKKRERKVGIKVWKSSKNILKGMRLTEDEPYSEVVKRLTIFWIQETEEDEQ